jgi:hypothetical protein
MGLKFGADVVDMECAAVAEAARLHGLEFAAVKAVADEADFFLPPMPQFVTENGKFATGRFIAYVALRPKMWPVVNQLRHNSRLASVNLSMAIRHLIQEYAAAQREENVPLA